MNNALHHESTNAARLVAANDGVPHCVRNGVDYGVHGRYFGSRHVGLPCRDSGAVQRFRRGLRPGTPVKSPCSGLLLCRQQVPLPESVMSCRRSVVEPSA